MGQKIGLDSIETLVREKALGSDSLFSAPYFSYR